ncbi:MAG: GTP-sensing pleiotropic transcriptional regulator CodY [Firmicutes bacterium]|nr:GTP-sensing pleiotropic transcriptional regulator CodY [Bacillota bacterium]
MSNILNKVRKLNWTLQESPTGVFSFDDLCEILSDLMEANVYILEFEGTVVGASEKIEGTTSLIKDENTGKYVLPEEFNLKLCNVNDTEANLRRKDVFELVQFDMSNDNRYYTVIPIEGGGNRWGTLVMSRDEPEFTDEDLVLGEYGATIVALTLRHDKLEEEKREARDTSLVQMAIGTLSYSETEAVQHIFSELEGEEGTLVASKIADRSGITRSVIVNALRKLESASVIETRSLGMKGTRIKILNPKLKSELENMK